MQLCLVCTSLRAGGTERVVSLLAKHLAARHEVSVVLLSAAEPFYELDSAVRVIQPDVGSRGQAGWRWYPRILSHVFRSLRQARYDLVLSFGETISPFILPVSVLCGNRTLVFNRASPSSNLQGKRGLLNPLVYPLAYRVVVQTRRSLEMMRRRYRFSRLEVWPNPVSVPSFVVNVDERPRTIVNVGTLGGQKNQQALIHAFAKAKDRSGWRLVLVGDGPDRDTLEQLCEKLGIRELVTFAGQRNDVAELLQTARIFAFSSLSEGFPNALAEALASGCACISFDCPTGPSDLIEHNVNGLLVETGNQDRFTAELSRLMTDTSMQKRLSTAAQRDIERFSANRVLEDFERLIQHSAPQTEKRNATSCD